jgi:hypothetical protein
MHAKRRERNVVLEMGKGEGGRGKGREGTVEVEMKN